MDMDNIIKEVLVSINKSGFLAYIVGGYVRDYILGIESKDIDIATDATPKDLMCIFKKLNLESKEYGNVSFKKEDYFFDITTFRKEIIYVNRRPSKIEYVKDLATDLKRRDFTINSLAMDKDGNIIDLYNSKNDILKRRLKVIGDVDSKFKEDPLRILRAIRFASIYSLRIDRSIIESIIRNKNLLKTLSYERKRKEIDLILKNKNFKKGLKLIKVLNLEEQLEFYFYDVKYSSNIIGYWCQFDIYGNYIFTKDELNKMNIYKSIIKSGINNYSLFKYDISDNLLVGSILGISIKKINKMYSKLPIKERKDLALSSEEIIKELNIKPSKKINDIIVDIEKKVLFNKLKNNKESIIKYLERYKAFDEE